MKKISILLLITCITFQLAACYHNESVITEKTEAPTNIDDEEEYYEIEKDNDYINAVNDFSKRISSSLLAGQGGNRMISPISIQMALALACAGADGNTKEEITNLLGLKGMDIMEISEHNKNLFKLLQEDNEISKLYIGNSLWLSNKASFFETYLMNAKDNYFADLYEVDFNKQSTAKLMGEWVAKQTGDLIHPQIELVPQQLLSIINTIYYKDEWITRFQEDETEGAPFYLTDGSTVECDYMHQTRDPYGYYKGEEYISFSLGLKGHGQMYFILPDEGVTIDELLEKPDNISKGLFMNSNKHAKIIFRIPKFSFGCEVSLKEILKEMGIKEAFTIDADFSAMTDEETIYLADIIHQTHIGIDEKGVEAAAFTNIIYTGAAPPQEEVIEITLNRPFLFAIKSEDVILFMGVVNNPLDR